MARLDFSCPACGAEVIDRIAPAGTPPPSCAAHEPPVPMEIAWREAAAVDVLAEPIEFEHDGGRVEKIETLSRIRQIEREAEIAVGRGEGRPIVFRDFAQDHSNRDLNVFQKDHPQVRREELLRTRRGKPIVTVGGVQIEVHGDPNASE